MISDMMYNVITSFILHNKLQMYHLYKKRKQQKNDLKLDLCNSCRALCCPLLALEALSSYTVF